MFIPATYVFPGVRVRFKLPAGKPISYFAKYVTLLTMQLLIDQIACRSEIDVPAHGRI